MNLSTVAADYAEIFAILPAEPTTDDLAPFLARVERAIVAVASLVDESGRDLDPGAREIAAAALLVDEATEPALDAIADDADPETAARALAARAALVGSGRDDRRDARYARLALGLSADPTEPAPPTSTPRLDDLYPAGDPDALARLGRVDTCPPPSAGPAPETTALDPLAALGALADEQGGAVAARAIRALAGVQAGVAREREIDAEIAAERAGAILAADRATLADLGGAIPVAVYGDRETADAATLALSALPAEPGARARAILDADRATRDALGSTIPVAALADERIARFEALNRLALGEGSTDDLAALDTPTLADLARDARIYLPATPSARAERAAETSTRALLAEAREIAPTLENESDSVVEAVIYLGARIGLPAAPAVETPEAEIGAPALAALFGGEWSVLSDAARAALVDDIDEIAAEVSGRSFEVAAEILAERIAPAPLGRYVATLLAAGR